MVKWLQRWTEWLYITETIQLRTVAYGTLVRTFILGSGKKWIWVSGEARRLLLQPTCTAYLPAFDTNDSSRM